MKADVISNFHDLALNQLDLKMSLRMLRTPVVITDPNQHDNPIVYANDAFLELTGYPRDEVLGRNCNFLQGPDTDPAAVDQIRVSLASGKISTVEILNYRKDGSTFLNSLQIGPVTDAKGTVLFHFGSQLDVTEQRNKERRLRDLDERELLHRLRNIVNVMNSVITMTAREVADRDAYVALITGRLRALSDAHLRTLTSDAHSGADVAELSQSVVKHYVIDPDRQLQIEGQTLSVAPDAVTSLSLVLHELSTNAVKHGALSCREGQVALQWEPCDNGLFLRGTWTETGGPALDVPDHQSGSEIVRKIISSVGGDLSFDWRPEGLVATICVPRMNHGNHRTRSDVPST